MQITKEVLEADKKSMQVQAENALSVVRYIDGLLNFMNKEAPPSVPEPVAEPPAPAEAVTEEPPKEEEPKE